MLFDSVAEERKDFLSVCLSMARADLHFVHDSMLPIAKHARVTDPESSADSTDHSLSTLRKDLGIGRSQSVRNDSHPTSRPTVNPSDSKDSLPSSSVSAFPPVEPRRRISLQSRRANTDPLFHEQPWTNSSSRRSIERYVSDPPLGNNGHSLRKAKSTRSKVHVKPLLKRLSRDASRPNSLDLSRSSLEYEGIGIFTNFDREAQQQSERHGNNLGRTTMSGLPHRSISGASQFSTGGFSGVTNRISQRSCPPPQAPSAYASLGQSYQASSADSDDSGDGGRPSVDGQTATFPRSDRFRRVQRRLSLQTHGNSFTGSPGISPANVTGRHSFGYSRDNNGNSLDSPSQNSRSSLDFVFRPKQRASTDPVSRAATVKAAREAFEEKEAAKTRKFERQQMKAEEKQMRRIEKQQVHGTPIGNQNKGRTFDDAAPENDVPEKLSSSEPNVPPHPQPESPSWRSQSKNSWMLFVTWLQTRVFKLRRKLRRIH